MSDLKERVEAALGQIRPALQADGGDISLVNIEGNVVTVALEGACKGCPMSQMTLRMGVERALKEMVPEVERVDAEGVPSDFVMPNWDEEEEEEEAPEK